MSRRGYVFKGKGFTRFTFLLLLVLTLFPNPAPLAAAGTGEQETLKMEDVAEMSLDDLLNVEITTASKFSEKISETPSTIIVVTAETIAKRGYNDLYQLLQDLPGFDVTIKNGASYALAFPRGNQGEIAERTLLFIDGVNFQSLGFQNMNVSRSLSISSIKRVEVLYGPSSAIYGPDAFCGIINIITKSPRDLEGKNQEVNVHVGGGAYSTGYVDMNYLGKINDIGVSFSARYYKSDEPDYSNKPGYFSNEIIRNSWKPMLDRYGTYEDPTDCYAFNGRLFYKDLELGFHHLRYKDGSGPEYPLDKTLPSPQWEGFRNLIYLRYSRDLSDKVNISALLTYRNGDTPPSSAWAERYDYDSANPDDPGYGNADVSMGYWQNFNEQFAFSQDFVYRPNKTTTFNGGISLAVNDFQKGYLINWGDWVEDYEEAYTGYPTAPVKPGQHARYKMSQAGAYLQVKKVFLEGKLVVVPGIRYDYNSIYDNTFNPRIGISYKLSKSVVAKFSYGSGFQYPSPRNLYGGWAGTQVSDVLEPEKIQALEGGLSFAMGRGLVNEINAYYNRIQNTNLQGENLPERRIFGVEYKVNYRKAKVAKGIEDLDVYLNYNYLDPKYKEVLFEASTGRSDDFIGNTAVHKINFGLGAQLFNLFHLQLRCNYVGERITVLTNPIEKIDSYLVAHMNILVREPFKLKGLTVSFLIRNLFDSDYFHPGVVAAGAGEDTSHESTSWYSSRLPQPGRHFLVGLKYNF